jgi:hypothetical protein
VTVEELLTDPGRRGLASTPEADALLDVDALQEAALLDVRLDLVTSSAWLLFDCRGALQIEMGNTAVVVVRSVQALRWSGDSLGPRTWRAVLGWIPSIMDGRLSLAADVSPSGRLEIVGLAGEFYVGDVPGGDEAPPNFESATDSEVRSGLAHWSSEFEPVHASFLDVGPGRR